MTKHFSSIGIKGDRAQLKSLRLLLFTTSLVCFVSILFPSGSGQHSRMLISAIIGSYLMALYFFLTKTRNVEAAIYLAAIGASLAQFGHFVLSGEVFYLAISVVVPIAASLYMSVRSSLLVLALYSIGAISACVVIESDIWQPLYQHEGYVGNLWVATVVVVLVAQSLTAAAVWNRHLSDKYETIVNGYCDGIIEADHRGRVVSTSGKFFERTLENENRTWKGSNIADLIDPADREILECSLEGANPFGFETRARLDEGDECWIRLFGAVANSRKSDARRWILGVENISREVMSRNRLNEVSRLESLGELCGGLAHDFNNLLTVTGIYTAMIEDEELRRKLEHANSEAIELTSQLLAFARQQHTEKKVIDLSDYLFSIQIVIDRLVPANIKLHWNLNRDCFVLFDSAEMQQVLINLVSNSIHAMPKGGELTISLGVSGASVLSTTYDMHGAADPFVELRVTDTGSGMTEEVRKRALDPFFTTKPRGEGTGIGLSTVHGLVASSGGDIIITSEPGSGTSVLLRLPLARSDSEFWKDPEFERNRKSGDSGKLEGTILLVEDRDALRHAVASTLKMAGYEVHSYADAESALEALDHLPSIDALVSDIVLSGMSGVDLKSRCRQFDPHLSVVLMSGYQQVYNSDEMNEENGRFLTKPFLMNDLIDMIESLNKQKQPR